MCANAMHFFFFILFAAICEQRCFLRRLLAGTQTHCKCVAAEEKAIRQCVWRITCPAVHTLYGRLWYSTKAHKNILVQHVNRERAANKNAMRKPIDGTTIE